MYNHSFLLQSTVYFAIWSENSTAFFVSQALKCNFLSLFWEHFLLVQYGVYFVLVYSEFSII